MGSVSYKTAFEITRLSIVYIKEKEKSLLLIFLEGGDVDSVDFVLEAWNNKLIMSKNDWYRFKTTKSRITSW